MPRIGAAHKLVILLDISDAIAQKLAGAGYYRPSVIQNTTKRKLREDAGLSQSEVNAVKARWA